MTENHTTPRESSTAAAATTDVAWRAVAEATQGAYDVLAELARDADGAVAFVGRPLAGGDLVILKLEPDPATSGPQRYTLFELRGLDDTVPAPRISCPICSAQVAAWRGRCAACGNVIGAGTDGPVATDVLLAFYQFVSATYDIVGELATEGSGPPAYLVRTRDARHHLVLRLSLGGPVASGGTAYLVDVLPLAGAGEAPGSPTRVPLDVAAPTAIVARPTAAPSILERVCPQCGSLFGAGTLFCPKDGASLRLVTTGTDLVGQLIDDRYYVEQRLGEGGMGEVYIAHQVRTGRKCALKLMHRSMTQDPDAVGRFRREAASACAISHPNVATIFDSGETLDQRPYFAMEFVDGRSLSQVIRDEGPLDAWRAADIGRQIADGLSAAHDLDIIHRDLKPENVMVGTTRGGADFVKLVDFGIAKPTKGVGNTLTRTGFILGTPAYMSPEQLCADKLDGRTDLYSLGCVLHEMLTSETPFAGQSLEMLMMRRLTEPPPHPRTLNDQVPPVLDDIVARLLARTADERYPDARAVVDVLGAAQDAIGGRRSTSTATPGTGAQVRTPTPGPREPSIVKVATGVEKPRRSRDVAPPPPMSPAIPFRAPSLGMPTPSGETTLALPTEDATRRRPWRAIAVAAAVVVIGGGAFAAWRLTTTPAATQLASPGLRSTAAAAAPQAVTSPATPATSDSQTLNTQVASTKPQRTAVPARGADTKSTTKAAPQQQRTASSASGQSPSVVQSSAPAPIPGAVAVTPPLAAQRDTKPQEPALPPAVVETKPRPDAAADAERIEAPRARESIESYVRAIGEKRMDVLRQIFPGMGAGYRDGYDALFKTTSDLTTRLTGTPTVAIHGNTADAQFAYDLDAHDPSRGAFSRHFSLHAKLQRTDQRWIFVSLDAAP
jgi:eukaryotic-like serine/threonine-protein kinase